jgi:hypothetical protein
MRLDEPHVKLRLRWTSKRDKRSSCPLSQFLT